MEKTRLENKCNPPPLYFVLCRLAVSRYTKPTINLPWIVINYIITRILMGPGNWSMICRHMTHTHGTETKPIVSHSQKSGVQWSIICKFACTNKSTIGLNERSKPIPCTRCLKRKVIHLWQLRSFSIQFFLLLSRFNIQASTQPIVYTSLSDKKGSIHHGHGENAS